MLLLLLALAATPDGGAGALPSGPRLLAASLRERFSHCEGMTLREAPMLELSLPAPCRFKDGVTAKGTLRIEFSPLASADAPVRERAQRFRVTAAPFSLGELEFEGVLLEGRMSEDAKDLKLLPRLTPLKSRRRTSSTPSPGWVSSTPPKDRMPNPIGDAALDLARGLAAAPEVTVGLAKALAQALQEGALRNAPELVALWALSGPEDARDGG